MIRPLRRAHRWTWLLLAPALPLLLAAGLLARPAPPLGEPLGGGPLPLPGVAVREVGGLFEALKIRARTWPGEGGPVLELTPQRDLQRPDVLVYWAASGGPESALPDDARLVGRLAGTQSRRLRLPAVANHRSGRLYLYSLGHQALIASDSVPAFED